MNAGSLRIPQAKKSRLNRRIHNWEPYFAYQIFIMRSKFRHFLMTFIISITAPAGAVFCQEDSSVSYHDHWGGVTTKDSAYIYTKFTRLNNLWLGQVYYSKGDVLQSSGTYRNRNSFHPVGTFKNYSPDGILLNIAIYDDSSKIIERTHYFSNGTKSAYQSYGGKGYEQKCWDSLGNELPYCKIESEAHFKGGAEGWMKYLRKNLKGNVAAKSGAPIGMYTVELKFIVDQKGKVGNIEAIKMPELCQPCTTEAIRVLRKSPDWEPALQNGKYINYLAFQPIIFEVK